MERKEKGKTGVDLDIARLMEQAASRPGSDDPMGMVGFGAIWLAAVLWIKQEEGKMERRERKDGKEGNDG